VSVAQLDFTGDASKAQAAHDRLIRENARLRESIRKTNEEAVQGAQKSLKALDAWGAGLEKLRQQNDKWAAGMARISASNAASLQKLQQQQQLAQLTAKGMDTATRKNVESSSFLDDTLGGLATKYGSVAAAAGLAAVAYSDWRTKTDELAQSHINLSEQFTKTLAQAGMLAKAPQIEGWLKSLKGATTTQGLAAVGGVLASGETLSDQRAFDVAGQVARLGPTGMDLQQTGSLAADIADIVGEGTSAEDVADMTVGLQKQLREKVGEFSGRKFQKQIANLKMAGMGGEDALVHAVAALQSEQGAEALKVLATKGKRTPEQRRMLREVFAPETLERLRGELSGFQTSNLAQQQLDALGGSGLTRTQMAENIVREAEEEQSLDLPGTPLQQSRRFTRASAYRRGFLPYLGALTQSAASRTAEFVNAASGGMVYRQAGVTESQEAIDELKIAERRGIIGKGEADALIAALKENTAATKASTQPRVNIDAHTE
jgi:hypothetical protein